MPSKLKHYLLHTWRGHFAVLSGTMLVLFGVAAAVVAKVRGLEMLPVVGVAAAICYFSSFLAILGETGFAVRNPVFGMGWSMTFRTGLPLVAALTIQRLGGRFADPVALYCLLFYYFGALITHALLFYSASSDTQPLAPDSRPAK
jgi:hypothetical protein